VDRVRASCNRVRYAASFGGFSGEYSARQAESTEDRRGLGFLAAGLCAHRLPSWQEFRGAVIACIESSTTKRLTVEGRCGGKGAFCYREAALPSAKSETQDHWDHSISLLNSLPAWRSKGRYLLPGRFGPLTPSPRQIRLSARFKTGSSLHRGLAQTHLVSSHASSSQPVDSFSAMLGSAQCQHAFGAEEMADGGETLLNLVGNKPQPIAVVSIGSSVASAVELSTSTHTPICPTR
jgi:hypothetical protein